MASFIFGLVMSLLSVMDLWLNLPDTWCYFVCCTLDTRNVERPEREGAGSLGVNLIGFCQFSFQKAIFSAPFPQILFASPCSSPKSPQCNLFVIVICSGHFSIS